MKKRIISHIQYTWILYLLFAVAAILIWSMVFQGFLQLEQNEQVGVIFYSEGWNSHELYVHLSDNIGSITEQDIKKISVEQCAANKSVLLERLGTDMYSRDIMVIEESLLDNSTQLQLTVDIEKAFYALDRERLDAVFGDIEVNYLVINDKSYGIYLNDASDGVTTNFEKFYSGEDTFVLFFSRETVNIDCMNEKGQSGDGAAIDLVKYLLKEAE